MRRWVRADRAALISQVADLRLTDEPDVVVEAAEALVALLLAFRHGEDAVGVARSFLSICDASKSDAAPVTKGRARLLVGRALAAAGEKAEAVPMLLLALADFTEQDERGLAARATLELADALLALGGATQALVQVDQAIAGFQRVGDVLNAAHASALRARVLKACGSETETEAETESVDAGWDAAEQLAALNAPRCEANALFRTGMTLLTRLRRPEEAVEAFRPCAQRRAEIGDRRGAAQALRLLGTALHLGGDLDQAATVLRRAAEAAKAAGDATELAESRRHLASVLNAAGRPREAAVLARSAVDHFAQTARPQAEGQALTVLALAQAGTGHHPSAVSTAQHAVAVLARAGVRSDTATAYAMLGTLSVNMGRYTGGVQALREALRLFIADGDAGHAAQVRESLAAAEAARHQRAARPVAWH